MSDFAAGDTVFDTVIKGASRAQIAKFSEGTEDPNPIHVDKSFAASAGFPDILQQGPMTTAHFARLLTESVGQLKSLDVFFKAPVFPEEDLRLVATLDSIGPDGLKTCKLSSAKIDGTVTATGVATWM